jgi:hypothetical protein
VGEEVRKVLKSLGLHKEAGDHFQALCQGRGDTQEFG